MANSNAASRFYVCSTPQNNVLNQTDYEALTWVEVTGIGSRGETGRSTNILTYATWDTSVVQKAKGQTDAGSPELELARIPTDAGQIILRAASVVGNNSNYAFKELRSDGPTGGTGTVIYNRGLVVGPKRPGGRNEDFDLEVFMLAFQQEEIVVAPTSAGTAPYVTAIPTITGTATVGQVLTAVNGTWAGDVTITYSYQWYANNIAIAAGTSGTYTLLSAQLGKRITVRVNASNNSGTASATSAPTAAVA
jgi:hypothetical protein